MNSQLFQQEYSRLNQAQRQAVDSLYGPLMVVAGPGTGKTQIIGLRTANILLKTDTQAENILISTFTDAGVIAIKKRLATFIGTEASKVKVCTIHSFAQDVIAEFPEFFTQQKLSQAIDDVDSLEILGKILDEGIEKNEIEFLTTPFDPHMYLRDIKSAISTLKQEGVSPSKLVTLTQKQSQTYDEILAEIKPTLKKYETTKTKHEKHINKLGELKNIFEKYQQELRLRGLYDFNDMINFVLEVFRDNEEICLHYAEKFQFIMLDEFQDTNNAQNEIIDLIIANSEKPNILVVGDDDQSIYRFQGANIENMLDFSEKYSDTKIVVLQNNYRSTQEILDTSESLIENNEERLIKKIPQLEKKLTASGGFPSGEKPKIFHAKSEKEEQAFILKKIRRENLQENAIIVRNNREVKAWSDLLTKNNIPVVSKLKSNILESEYIDFILNYFSLLENPYKSDEKLIDILRSDFISTEGIDVILINQSLHKLNYTRRFKVQIFDYLGDESYLENLELKNIEALRLFRENFIALQTASSEKNFSVFFNTFLEKNNILEYIETHGNFDDLQDIFTLFAFIKKLQERDNTLTLKKFLHKIELLKKYNYPIHRQNQKAETQGVQIMTAHGSKGLEFETVFIPGLYSGNWDNKRRIERLKLPEGVSGMGLQDTKASSGEEDRRLFFVALTRAKKEIFLSFPAGIDNKAKIQSSFLLEIEKNIQVLEEKITDESITQILVSELQNMKKNSTSEDELRYIENFLEHYKLSASDLNKFLEDPQIFLRESVFKYPFVDNEFTIFGKVYHRTLELFYIKMKQENKTPNASYLTSVFEKLIKLETLTPQELERLLEKGISGLKGFYQEYENNFGEAVAVEYNFRQKGILFENFPLTGKIDKIESIGNTGTLGDEQQLGLMKTPVSLVDYKTGSIKTLGNIKGLDRYGNKKIGGEYGKYFRQLMFYKLLCEQDREFCENFEVASFILDFVEGKDGKYKKLSVDISEEEYHDFKQELQETAEKIFDIKYWKNFLNL